MKIIIPMTGYGSRFVAAGYKELKPLIKVQGKPIVQWIVQGMYTDNDEFIFVCRQEHVKKITGMKKMLESLADKVEVLTIDNWEKREPVFDIMRISEHIPDEEPN